MAETGIEAHERPLWLRFLANEVAQARTFGVPLEGICWYPITDYPGWLDDRHCPGGLFGYVEADGTRPVYEPLADEILSQSTSVQVSRPRQRGSRVKASSARAHRR